MNECTRKQFVNTSRADHTQTQTSECVFNNNSKKPGRQIDLQPDKSVAGLAAGVVLKTILPARDHSFWYISLDCVLDSVCARTGRAYIAEGPLGS